MHVTLAFLSISAVLGFQVPVGTVEGYAVFFGTDRPAARMTIHVFDQRDPAFKVVTDDQGRFRAKVPTGLVVPQPHEQREQRCWAEAEGAGRWTVEPVDTMHSRQPREQIQDYVDQALARPVQSASWEHGKIRVEITEPGEVAILVRGPDGLPVTDRPVQVTPNWPAGEMFGSTSARFNGRTDAEGRFRIRWFPSIRQFQVAVPELGFASTQSIEIKAGATANGETRPLARFASISGTSLVKLTNAEVQLRHGFEELDPVAIDKDGRFEVRDIPPGHYTVQVREPNGSKIRSDQLNVWVAPGGKIEGLVINELPPLSPEAAEASRKSEARTMAGLNGKEGEGVWVEGTVRDTAGRPVPKAEVIVRTAYHGGMRMYEDVRSTTTDAAGHYSISGPIHGFVETLVVVALVKGHPPAIGNAPARTGDHDKASKLDLTIASVGGSATISVFKDGKPEPFCNVRLEGEGSANILAGFGWALGTQGPAKSALEAIAWPSANTDRNGVAKFENLIPGIYTVHATNGSNQAGGQRRGILEQDGANGEARGFSVVVGRDAKMSLAIASVEHRVKFQVFRPDGQPVTDQTVGISYGLGGTTSRGSMLNLNGQGIDDFTFDSAGLWTVEVRFRDTPVNSFPITEPCYEAKALVPVSIGAPITEPIRMVGTRLDVGSLRVRLLDDEGKPGRGAVVFPSQINGESPAASVDSRGEILFENVGNGEQWVSGSIEGPSPPSWSWGGPMPDDATLRGRFLVVPGVKAVVRPGRETLVELKAKRVGYIRGKFTPAPGHRVEEYNVLPSYDLQILEPSWRLDAATGNYLAGPFVAGPQTLCFQRQTREEDQQDCGKQVVEVVAGEVAHVDLKPGEPEPENSGRRKSHTMLGMGGISVIEGTPDTTPRVFMPDGKSPAFGAEALYFEPGSSGPVSQGRSDASGRLTWRGIWTSGDAEDSRKIEGVTRPTIVVRLPGHLGATVATVDEGKAMRLVLPPEARAEGRVTVGGRAPTPGSVVQVVAAHQGRGVLNGSLSVEVSPGVDGRFTLAGLTPGRYQIQAARDGIWVSKPVEMLVEPNKPTPPLEFDIPAPGSPVTLEVVDPAGQPFASRTVKVIRPEGPFAALWPSNLTTDASGRLTFFSLEAGMHAASVEGALDRASFTVPDENSSPVSKNVRRVVLPRSGP